MVGDLCVVDLPKKTSNGKDNTHRYSIQLSDNKTTLFLLVEPVRQNREYIRVITINTKVGEKELFGYSEINKKSCLELDYSNVSEIYGYVDKPIIDDIIDDLRHSEMFKLLKTQRRLSRKSKTASKEVKSGPSALTSIYYTGQKIQGGYNTHKG